MAEFRACLIDVYDTLVPADFSRHRDELSALAGITAQAWEQGFARCEDRLNDGRLSLRAGLADTVRGGGADPAPELVEKLARRGRELTLDRMRLHADAADFLALLRARGVATALVSNCGEDTRPALLALGLDRLTDELVLSCEVGVAKPAPAIFTEALTRLGATAPEAVLIDDQPHFCAAARALGMTAVQIVRDGVRRARDPGAIQAATLAELAPLFA